MKYTSSLNTSYRPYIGYFPNPWLTSDLKDENKVIEEYIDDKIRVWDADICGNKEVTIYFESGNVYKVEYSWWIGSDYDSDFNEIEDTYSLKDEVHIEKVEGVEIPKDRDWI